MSPDVQAESIPMTRLERIFRQTLFEQVMCEAFDLPLIPDTLVADRTEGINNGRGVFDYAPDKAVPNEADRW